MLDFDNPVLLAVSEAMRDLDIERGRAPPASVERRTDSSITVICPESAASPPPDGASYIYALRDPLSLEVRYVGVTCTSLRDRLYGHSQSAKSGRAYRDKWIKSLASSGVTPLIEALEVTMDRAREVSWISYLRDAGCRLTNLTRGGEGTLGWKPSEESLERMRAWQRGKITPPDVRAKISASLKGRSMPAHIRAKLSERRKGRKKPAGFGQAVSARLTGVRRTPEERAKVSAGRLALGLKDKFLSESERRRLASIYFCGGGTMRDIAYAYGVSSTYVGKALAEFSDMRGNPGAGLPTLTRQALLSLSDEWAWPKADVSQRGALRRLVAHGLAERRKHPYALRLTADGLKAKDSTLLARGELAEILSRNRRPHD